MKIYRSLLKDLEDEAHYKSLEGKMRLNILQQRFAFSVIWSFGGAVSTDYRKAFE